MLNETIVVDPEFQSKIPPLTAEEFAKLEENILADGEVREPLILWSNTIIDGHHRWKIIQKHPELPYRVKRMDFPDKWAAIVWMCRNQLGRRNLTPDQKAYLLGKEYEARKHTASRGEKGQFSPCRQNDYTVKRTCEAIANEHGVASRTVQRAAEFAKAMDEADAISPGFREAVLTGEVKAPRGVIEDICTAPQERKAEVVEEIRKGNVSTARGILYPKEMLYWSPPSDTDTLRQITVEEYYELLEAAIDNMDAALGLHMIHTHQEMLECEEGRNAIATALDKGEEVLQKYRNMIEAKASFAG